MSRRVIEQFPHCDPRVLHAPGACDVCDEFSVWQALREAWNIAFTGYVPTDIELPDPATHARGLAVVHTWPGNRPYRYSAEAGPAASPSAPPPAAQEAVDD